MDDGLADRVVRAADGAAVRIGDLWRDGPAFVLFVRQWGCVGCALQLDDLLPRVDVLAGVGVRVLIVGLGPVGAMTVATARRGLDRPGWAERVTVATDPDGDVFRAAGLTRSVWGTWGPPAWPGFFRGLAAGHRNAIVADPNLQGGAFLFDRGGALRFERRAAFLGDVVPTDDVVEVALALAAARADTA